jgi:hypothetical protein
VQQPEECADDDKGHRVARDLRSAAEGKTAAAAQTCAGAGSAPEKRPVALRAGVADYHLLTITPPHERQLNVHYTYTDIPLSHNAQPKYTPGSGRLAAACRPLCWWC